MILAYWSCQKVGEGATHCHAVLGKNGAVALGILAIFVVAGVIWVKRSTRD